MNTNHKYYYILTFDTTTNVMKAEALLKQHFPIAVMPVPREISSGCGLALRFTGNNEPRLFHCLKTFSIPGTLYNMGTVKENNSYPISKIFTFPTL